MTTSVQARKRKLGLLEDEDIANLASAASAQGSEFAEKDAAKENASLDVVKSQGAVQCSYLSCFAALLFAITLFLNLLIVSPDHSERAFYKELVKVIEASDVILEVLDARDPLGTRCIDMEKMVRKADPSKRIVLLLNKIGTIQVLFEFGLHSCYVYCLATSQFQFMASRSCSQGVSREMAYVPKRGNAYCRIQVQYPRAEDKTGMEIIKD